MYYIENSSFNKHTGKCESYHSSSECGQQCCEESLEQQLEVGRREALAQVLGEGVQLAKAECAQRLTKT